MPTSSAVSVFGLSVTKRILFAVSVPNIQIRKLPTSSFRIWIIKCKTHFFLVFKNRKSIYGNCQHCRQFPYLYYHVLNAFFCCFRAQNPNIVGSFRILIINSKTYFFWCLRVQNPNKETGNIVDSFGIWKRIFFGCFRA